MHSHSQSQVSQVAQVSETAAREIRMATNGKELVELNSIASFNGVDFSPSHQFQLTIYSSASQHSQRSNHFESSRQTHFANSQSSSKVEKFELKLAESNQIHRIHSNSRRIEFPVWPLFVCCLRNTHTHTQESILFITHKESLLVQATGVSHVVNIMLGHEQRTHTLAHALNSITVT